MKFKRWVLSALMLLFFVFFVDAVYLEISWCQRDSNYPLLTQAVKAVLSSEDILNRTFHLRYGFYECAGLFNRGIGRRNVDGVYRLENGYLVTFSSHTAALDRSVEAMCSLHEYCEEIGVPLLYVNLPRKSPLEEDLAIFGLSNGPVQRADVFLSALADAGIGTLDMRPYMDMAYENHYDAYFKTDHHWKISSGLYCAQVLSKELADRYDFAIDPEAIVDEAFSITLLENSWLGESGKKTGSTYCGLDDFEVIKPLKKTHFHLQIPSRKLDTTGDFSIMMDESRYATDYWSKRYGTSFYYSYLFGNDGMQIIQNEDQPEGKILVIKDSFSQAVNPFLAMTVGTVVSWDPRSNEEDLAAYIADNDFDLIIVMYNDAMLANEELFSFFSH